MAYSYQTKNTATYTGQSKNSATYALQSKTPPIYEFLLLESGDYILQELLDKLILEHTGQVDFPYTYQTKNIA